jgi:hypothetical protein
MVTAIWLCRRIVARQAAHVVAHPVAVPHRLAQQPLHPMRRGVSGLFGQLPTRPRVHIGQESKQIGAGLPARLDPPEPARDPGEPRVELGQPLLGRDAAPSGRHEI